MPKITLPPKVKCWRCTNGKICIVVGKVKAGPDIPEKMVGKPLYGSEPCDCDAGERYVFDDLAAAIRSANLLFNVAAGIACDIARINSAGLNPPKTYADGPNPTAALLSAITKFNAE